MMWQGILNEQENADGMVYAWEKGWSVMTCRSPETGKTYWFLDVPERDRHLLRSYD